MNDIPTLSTDDTKGALTKAVAQLYEYCRICNWRGYDPFDGLNSRIVAFLPFLHNRVGRLLVSQAMKRSPINWRPFFLVPKELNPKGIALFISALIRLEKLSFFGDAPNPLKDLLNTLVTLKSADPQYFCWGYNFEWQSRYFLSSKFEPNIIVTTFAGNALLEAYEFFGDRCFLEMALSAGYFILNRLAKTHDHSERCFSYTQNDNSQVHNANLLGASFLIKLYGHTKQEEFLDYGLSAARFSANRQNEDGSWFYGTELSQNWIDHFHTGYNLCALQAINRCAPTLEFESALRRGYAYYRRHLFSKDGRPKYLHNKTYPVDIHCVSQSILTLTSLKEGGDDNMRQAQLIFSWAMTHMHDKRGFFYYQWFPWYTNKIPYMRWSQAWMLLALVTLLEEF
ncbi:hypothetical protein GX408_06530 [bacterium]|nr:hypothetical protein [bacterium]